MNNECVLCASLSYWWCGEGRGVGRGGQRWVLTHMPVKFPLRLTSCIISTHPIEMLVACLFCPQCWCCLFFFGHLSYTHLRPKISSSWRCRWALLQYVDTKLLCAVGLPCLSPLLSECQYCQSMAQGCCLAMSQSLAVLFEGFLSFLLFCLFVFCYCCTQLEREHLQRVFKGHCVVKVGCEMLFC